MSKKRISSSGPKCALALLRIILEAKKFQLKTTVVGHHASEPREGRVPKGIIRSTADGPVRGRSATRDVDGTRTEPDKSNTVFILGENQKKGGGGGVVGLAGQRRSTWTQKVGGKSSLCATG